MTFWKIAALNVAVTISASAAFAETEITLWHAMGGKLGETVNKIAEDFNASQDDYKITPVFKGSYEETLTAASPPSVRASSPTSCRCSTLAPPP